MILPRCFDFRDRLNRKGYWHWYVLSLLVIGIGAVIAMMIGLLGFGTPELRLNLILSCYLVTAAHGALDPGADHGAAAA